MTQYQRGYRAELKAKRQLLKEGCHVIRSAGSKSPFDLICFSKNGIRLIQVKYTADPNQLKIPELNDMINFAIPQVPENLISKEIWVLKKHARKFEVIYLPIDAHEEDTIPTRQDDA